MIKILECVLYSWRMDFEMLGKSLQKVLKLPFMMIKILDDYFVL